MPLKVVYQNIEGEAGELTGATQLHAAVVDIVPSKMLLCFRYRLTSANQLKLWVD